MAAYSPRRSSGPVLSSSSPSRRFNSQYSAPVPSYQSSSTSLRRPTSPTRVNTCTPSTSVSMDRPGSSNWSILVSTRVEKFPAPGGPKRTCMCSPTNHPGSFRCSLHKAGPNHNRVSSDSRMVSCRSSSRLNMRLPSMKNSLVSIGTVKGDLVTRALAALIRPASHKQRRRGEFRPRPSRLSIVSAA